MLRLHAVGVRYAQAVLALDGLSLEVAAGQIVALLGNNGSGKSTTLKAISGLLRADGGRQTSGSIEFDGRPLLRLDPADIVRLGVFHVMEGRRVFAALNVEENLLAGAHTRARYEQRSELRRVYDYFPRLEERRRKLAGYLSGGEQQMLAIGRALMAQPRLILLDEPSLGLAPVMVHQVFDIIVRINRDSGTSFLVVEQNPRFALEVASYAYVLDRGRVDVQGEARRLLVSHSVQDVYLGGGVAA